MNIEFQCSYAKCLTVLGVIICVAYIIVGFVLCGLLFDDYNNMWIYAIGSLCGCIMAGIINYALAYCIAIITENHYRSLINDKGSVVAESADSNTSDELPNL